MRATSIEDATSATTGAIQATNGGIGCKKDIWVGGNVNATDVNATDVNAVDITSTGNININDMNTIPFVYDKGSWVPRLYTLVEQDEVIPNGVLIKEAWTSPTPTIEQGYYERIGQRVTAWYDVSYDISGFENDGLFKSRWPVIDQLPFECKNLSGLPVSDSQGFTDESFADGKLGAVPAPGAKTYDYPYTGTILAKDSIWAPAIPPTFIPASQYVSDGRTIFISCNISQYLVVEGIGWAAYGSPDNFNIIFSGNYTIRFSGTISYFIG
jgi:hypothetical protein